MKLADRVNRIKESSTLAISAKAAAMRASGVDVIDFSAGEPDFPTPENVKQKGIEAIQSNFTKYTPTAGLKKLREDVAHHYQERYGNPFATNQVILCNGGKQALFNLVFSVVQEGDEVLIPAPYWVTFPEQVLLAGGNPVFVQTRLEDQFGLRAEEVERKISPRTKMLILNSPNNPSGAVISRKVMSDLVDLCSARDIKILFDETYDCFVFPPFEHTSPFHFLPKAREIALVVNTFSKVYAMTGWRLGFAVAPPEIVDACDRLQGHTTSNPCSISQMAGMEALEGDQKSVAVMFKEYARRRKFVHEAFSSMPKIRCNEPQGAFYVFPQISGHFNEATPDSVAFCRTLLEHCHVATVPGSAFGFEGHMRLSYATSLEKLQEGCRRIKDYLTRT